VSDFSLAPGSTIHLHRALGRIRDLGKTAGVVLNPATPLTAIEYVIELCGVILIMTVNPGFGGQDYIATMEPKIAEARKMIDATGRDIPLEVDGGISSETIGAAAAAGADTFVVGSALFRHPDGIAACVAEWERRRDALLGQLAGYPVVRPAGGWSLLLETPPLGLGPAELSARLLAERVAATPMPGWGAEVAERYIRFVYSNEPVPRLELLRQRLERAVPG